MSQPGELESFPSAPAQSPDVKPSSRRLSLEDVRLIRRVLAYARPFRGQIIIALILGVVAGVLTALNLLALIPVLEIVLEETDQDKLDRIERRVEEKDLEFRETTNPFLKVETFLESRKDMVRLAWNRWVMAQRERVIYILAGVLVIAQIIKATLEFTSKFMLQKSFYLAVVRLRNELYRKCLEMDLGDYQKITSGDLISRLNNDMRAVRVVFTNLISDVILQPFTIVFLLGALLILNWQMTLIVIAGVPFVVVPISFIGKKLRTMGKRDEEEDAKILSYSQETIQGVMIVKAFTGEQREFRKFRTLARDVARRQIRRERYRLYSEPFVEITASVAMAGVLCAGAYLILQSDNASMNPPEFLIYLAIMTRFYPPMKRLMNTIVKTQKSLASAERIFDIIDIPPTIVEKEGAVELPDFRTSIDFENVSFSYNAGQGEVLQDFSLTIPKGRRIALVGRTGAGKSTVARLLPRLYDVKEGRILIDGVDIRDVTLLSLRKLMAVVSQETILFNDTIANNIAYARPEASVEEIEQAARAAYAHEFIEKLPEGYGTIIGERGGQLSGGQRQRLAIARALLANTPILLLDEATSALDNESERIVQRAIEHLMENRTVLVIAHRLSTVRKADEIIVMEDGQIAERGTHEELLGKQGKYYDLLQAEELVGD